METWIIGAAAVLAVVATSLVKNAGWSGKTKHLVATVVSTVIAAVLFLTELGGVEDVNFVVGASSVHGMSQLIYNFVLKGTALNERLESF